MSSSTEAAKPHAAQAGRRASGAETPLNDGGAGFEPHELLSVLRAMSVGDFSVRLAGNRLGIKGKIADTFNEIVSAIQRMAQQLQRVGREGQVKDRVKFSLSDGA